jgi:pheromone shutdown protein TraB
LTKTRTGPAIRYPLTEAGIRAGSDELVLIENANEVGLDVIRVDEQRTSLAWMLRRPQESSVPAVLLRARINLQPSRGSRLNEIAVSDHATLEGLTQFLTQLLGACPQLAEDKSIRGTR